MGVAGLWDVLRPAAKTRSLTHIAIKDGFEANPDGKRGFRLGIDASIWFFHAEYGREGENPVLRTLFFRCATLMHTTFLPIFVFDGPKRPDFKRGKKINKTGSKLIPGMKQIVEAFGFEWRTAPGEAEAELAYLNRIGAIDGILSDDVDNFLFGAITVIRNSSNNLSGNRSNPILNSAGKDDKNHSRIFKLEDIEKHPDIRLTRGGMILIGLMSGGDYQQGGLMRCGVTTAHGLAKCGFGDSLLAAAVGLDRHELQAFLITWRHDLKQELRTNSKREIGRKQVALANSIPADFPNIDILLSYVNPITSETMGRESNNLKLTWSKEPDLSKLAATCELYFEWGYKEAIIKRFRTIMWHSIVLRILRRGALDVDSKETAKTISSTPKKKGKKNECGTPSRMIAKHFTSLDISTPRVYTSGSESEEEDLNERLILKIHSMRSHASTDGLPEYRLEIAPKQLVKLAGSGIQGLRVPEGPDEWDSDDEEDEDEGGKKRKKGQPIDPETHMRLWMPACIVELVEPQLVRHFEDGQEQKRVKKSKAGIRAAKATKNPRKTKTAPSIPFGDGSDVFSSPVIEKPRRKHPSSSITLDSEPSSSEEYKFNLLNPNLIPSYKVNDDQKFSEHLSREPLSLQETNTKSPSKPIRTGIKDLTKKKGVTTAQLNNDLKSFFPVIRAVRDVQSVPSSSKESIKLPAGRQTPELTADVIKNSNSAKLPSPNLSKQKVKAYGVNSTTSEPHEQLKKSPRKNIDQNYAQANRRASSPSPATSGFRAKNLGKVIEISTDSDSDHSIHTAALPLHPMPPLLAAKARFKKAQQPATSLSKKRLYSNTEIIDLT